MCTLLNAALYYITYYYSIGLVVPLQDAMSSGARAAFPTLLCYCSAAIVTFFLGLGMHSRNNLKYCKLNTCDTYFTVYIMQYMHIHTVYVLLKCASNSSVTLVVK